LSDPKGNTPKATERLKVCKEMPHVEGCPPLYFPKGANNMENTLTLVTTDQKDTTLKMIVIRMKEHMI
jgi:hypothetical protein